MLKIENNPKPVVYPLAFKSVTDSVVVLFVSLKSGLKIAPDLENDICHHWLPHTNKKVWAPVNMTIGC